MQSSSLEEPFDRNFNGNISLTGQLAIGTITSNAVGTLTPLAYDTRGVICTGSSLPGSGTVTSITAGTGLTGGTITTTGTFAVATSQNLTSATIGTLLTTSASTLASPTVSGLTNTSSNTYYLTVPGTSGGLVSSQTVSGGGGGGSVTSISASGTNIVCSPSTITTTGTVGFATSPTFSGTMSCGAMVCSGTSSVAGLTSSGAITSGTNALTCGSLTCGAETAGPITSSTTASMSSTLAGVLALNSSGLFGTRQAWYGTLSGSGTATPLLNQVAIQPAGADFSFGSGTVTLPSATTYTYKVQLWTNITNSGNYTLYLLCGSTQYSSAITVYGSGTNCNIGAIFLSPGGSGTSNQISIATAAAVTTWSGYLSIEQIL